MKSAHRFIACGFLMLACTGASSAKPWRSIVPLHSTREDVERILGEPSRLDYIYDLDEATVRIVYANQPCQPGVPSWWGNWNVPRDTVTNIIVEADTPIPVRKLKIPNLAKYKWYTDKTRTTYYRLPGPGLEYSVQKGRVLDITYGPTEKDQGLLCRKNVPLIKY
jgi:hypothetical protein